MDDPFNECFHDFDVHDSQSGPSEKTDFETVRYRELSSVVIG